MLNYNIIMSNKIESNKTEFEQNLNKWIQIDEQIKAHNEKIKELRDKKQTLNTNLMNYASNHNLTNSTLKINDNKIRFCNVKTQQAITLSYLQKCLGEIIKNESQSTQIFEYIKNNRESKVVPEIKRL
jgi:hypothetical protein